VILLPKDLACHSEKSREDKLLYLSREDKLLYLSIYFILCNKYIAFAYFILYLHIYRDLVFTLTYILEGHVNDVIFISLLVILASPC